MVNVNVSSARNRTDILQFSHFCCFCVEKEICEKYPSHVYWCTYIMYVVLCVRGDLCYMLIERI